MLRLTTLGALDLRDRLGHPIREVLSQPKRLALLVYLVREARHGPVIRDRLLAAFWPEADEAHARNTLSQALHHLRQSLGADVLESQGTHAIVVNAGAIWCDASVFADAVDRGDCELALDLYRGEFCPALFVSDAPALEEWISGNRASLRREALGAGRKLAEQLEATGDAAGASRSARRTLALHPDDEADVRAMIALLERLGDAAGALTAYQDFARRMAAELELEPAPETTRLADAIRRRREQAAVAPGRVSPAPLESLAPSPATAPTRTPRTWLTPRIGIAAALVGIVTVGAAMTLRSRVPLSGPPVKTVAVFPFTVRSGGGLDYLKEGMVDLLSAKLDGAAGFRAVDPRSIIAAVGSNAGPTAPAAIADIANHLGAGWYVGGDVIEIAGKLQVTGSLFQVGRGPQAVSTATVAGDTAALFQLIDDLTGRLLAVLARGRDTSITHLAAVTTHSLPALKAFLQGEQAFRAGRDAQAAAQFREAAAIDSTFALAQYRLAVMATWVSVREVPDPAVRAARAVRYAERLTPVARDLLGAFQKYKELKGDEAERLYRRLTEAHPDNVEAWFMLGETHFHYNFSAGRSPEESRPDFNRVLALEPSNPHAMLHLARLAAMQNRTGTLDSIAARYVERNTDAERVIEIHALQAFMGADTLAQATLAAQAVRMDPVVGFGVMYAALSYAHNTDAASIFVVRAPVAPRDTDYVSRVTRRMYSQSALSAGQWHDQRMERLLGAAYERDWVFEGRALAASEPLFNMSPASIRAMRDTLIARATWLTQPPVGQHFSEPMQQDVGDAMRTYLTGLLNTRLGDTAAAARNAATLDATRNAGAAQARQLAVALRAELARTQGDLRTALRLLNGFRFGVLMQAETGLAHWGVRERFLRAEVLLALGQHADATPWYESYVSGAYYDLPLAPLAFMRLGEIAEREGDAEAARRHYRSVVRQWHAADAELQPLVARAQLALSRLQAVASR